MLRNKIIILICLLVRSYAFSQNFEMVPPDIIAGPSHITFGNILVTSKGSSLVASSMQLCEIDGMEMRLFDKPGLITDDKGQKFYLGKNSNILKDDESVAGIKLLCEGPDKIVFVVSNNNNFGFIDYKKDREIELPPFYFPQSASAEKVINQIYIDKSGTLFVGTNTDSIYYIENATNRNTLDAKFKVFMFSLDKDSNLIIIPSRQVKTFSLGHGVIPYSFCPEPGDDRMMLIGTNNGLFRYDKKTGKSVNYFNSGSDEKLTITHIEVNEVGSVIWFSTLENGIGRFELITNSPEFFPYPKKNTNKNTKYPVRNFSRKSPGELFVAIGDSVPAVFNTDLLTYTFINDSIFYKTKNVTDDIKADELGNLYVSKGGGFFISKPSLATYLEPKKTDSSLIGPYIRGITIHGTPSYSSKKINPGRDELLTQLDLNYDENNIGVLYSCRGINPDSLIYAWKADNFSTEWLTVPYSLFGENSNSVDLMNLKPGRYVLHVKARSGKSDWLKKEIQLVIIISRPYWQTWWFWTLSVLAFGTMMSLIVLLTIKRTRKKERLIARHEKELIESEAKALRAQMNPHFIFNCLNSIKAIIQKHDEDKAVTYLTTFSKLIRTIFQNSDKRQITLFDEIETCRLYTELEGMRFGKNLTYYFNIDPTIDLKSIMIPALIIQPFIENAIWHGLMPKESGGLLNINIYRKDQRIYCEIDDNGIGRELSIQNKFKGSSTTHESKGVRLTQSRLELNNSLNHGNASINIEDKRNEDNQHVGTKVVLSFEEG